MTRPAAVAIAVGAERCWVDGAEFRSPLLTAGADIGQLVERAAVAAGKGPAITLILLDDALPILSLPPVADAVADDVLGLVRGLGWRVGKPSDWVWAFRDGRPAVSLYVPAWTDPRKRDRPVLIDPADPAGTTRRLARYAPLAGYPLTVTPGVTMVRALRQLAWKETPYWAPPTMKRRCSKPIADAEHLTAWETPDKSVPDGWHIHPYDSVQNFLTAAAAVDVARGDLERRRGKGSWDPKRAGYWLIEPPVWQHDQMPDPVHDQPRDDQGRVWVATPTLALIARLADEGECSAPVLHDSWTAPGGRVLRRWAEHTRDALAGLAGPAPASCPTGDARLVGTKPTDPEDAAIWSALKETYKRGLGYLAYYDAETTYRPDWWAAVVAQARSVAWLKFWTIGKAEARWPYAIYKVDLVEYLSPDPDPITAAPAGLKLGESLGCYRPGHGWPAVSDGPSGDSRELVHA